MTVMVNSGDVNGIPGRKSKYLLNDILKKNGVLKVRFVSDWEDFAKIT